MTHLLRSLIHQVLLESDEAYKPVAPHNALFGKYAFANVRVGSPKPPPEEDTQSEELLYRNLISHFSANQPLSKVYTDQILDFIEKDLYSDVFRSPLRGTTLYRGLSIENKNRHIVEKFLPKGVSFNDVARQVIETGEDFASFETQLDLTNRDERYTASWTKKLDNAYEFAASGVADDFGIILCAGVEDNPGKLIDCFGLYKLHEISSFKDEREVIAAGTIRVSEVRIRPTQTIMTEFKVAQIKNLPKNRRTIKGGLYLTNTNIASLPDGLVIEGNLDLVGVKSVKSLPGGLVVKGDLFLAYSGVTTLPEDLQVDWRIYGLDRKYWENVPEHLKDKLR